MTDYLETGETGFNGYFKGLPKGEITIIKGDIGDMLLLWSEVLKVDGTGIYSEFRADEVLKEKYDKVIENIDDIDEELPDLNLLVLELDDIFKTDTDILEMAKKHDVPIMVISNDPTVKTIGSAYVVLEEIANVKKMMEVDSKIVIRRHMGLSFEDRARVYDVTYKPLPFVDDNTQH